MICGHGHGQKFKYPYSQDHKIIRMPYVRAKAIDQIPALCPASPPAGLTLMGALRGDTTQAKSRSVQMGKRLL